VTLSLLTFDTETTGKLAYRDPPTADTQPSLVQLGARLETLEEGKLLAEVNVIIEPVEWIIPVEASAIHGIDQATAKRFGISLANALWTFKDLFTCADVVSAHNIDFDRTVLIRALHQAEMDQFDWASKKLHDTMKASTQIVRIPHQRPRYPNDFKWPTLTECVRFFFGEELDGAHDAMVDVRACARVHRELCRIGAF